MEEDEDKVIKTNQKPPKNPKEAAINKLKEASAKETQKKVDEQITKTIAAGKVYKAEKEKLAGILAESEEDKATLADILSDL